MGKMKEFSGKFNRNAEIPGFKAGDKYATIIRRSFSGGSSRKETPCFSAGRSIFLVFIFTGSLLSGCASTNTFRSYPAQINPLIQEIKIDRAINLNKNLANKVNCGDKILYLMERGRIAQIQGDFDTSKKNFDLAIQAIKESDEKALISVSGAVSQVSAVAVNDNAIPYRADGYERVMLHHFQALNYLANNDLEGAGVEIRLAGAEQNDSLARHEKEIARAQEEAGKKNISLDASISQVNNAYAGMDQAIGSLKNSFQNAYAFYLSGIVYEMLNQPNDAYIDYKKAIQIYPDNHYLQRDVLRLARFLKMNDDLDQYKTAYPEAAQVKMPPKSGELIILFDDDFVAQKKEIKIPVPVSFQNINFIAIAFPIYTIGPFKPAALSVSESGQVLGESEPISNINALALKSLKEKVPSILVRQLIRAATKAALAKTAEDQGGWVGSLVATAYNVFSESADLRSWLTLPADAQITRLALPAGEHAFSLVHKDSQAALELKASIKEKGITIVYIMRAGNKLYFRVMP